MTDNTQLFKSCDSASTDIQLFHNVDFGNLHVAIVRDEVCFIAKNVCDALDISNVSQALSRLDDDEKGIISNDTLGGSQKMLTVNEAGLYALVFSSKKPEAKNFKRWVTHEVIPSIRKHGVYATPETAEKLMNDPDFMIATFTVLKDERERRMELEAENAELAPKALFADSVANADNLILVRELAHILRQNGIDVGQNRLFEWLREDGYLEKRRNEPTQRSLDLGIMRVVEHTHTKPDGSTFVTRTPKITAKGQVYFVRKYAGSGKVA